MMRILRAGVLIAIFCFSLGACKYDKYEIPSPSDSCYPNEVEAIIKNKCATAGCHNTISSVTAGGLDFSTYDKMLDGSLNGSVVIPFRPDLSTLLYFTNVDTTLGIAQPPTMPLNAPPLSKQEYLILKNWIADGLPCKDGSIPFSGNPSRKKFYVVNQGCDLLAVFDAEKRVVMRYKDVGLVAGVQDAPHNIKMTPDGKYYLIVFMHADVVQMFDTETDMLVANIPIGNPSSSGQWNTITVSKDSRTAYAVDFIAGQIAVIDLVAKTAITLPGFGYSLHGVALNATDDTLYLTEDQGNRILTIPVNDIQSYYWRNLRQLIPEATSLQIHEIAFTPDYNKYFVTCGHAHQVWMFDAVTNALLDTFHVAQTPQEIAISKSTDYLFITCMGGNAVEVFNYKTLTHVKTIPVGLNPHGIAVDDAMGVVYVLNRTGHAHHESLCAGANGNMNTISLQSLTVLPGTPELSVDPYQVTVKP